MFGGTTNLVNATIAGNTADIDSAGLTRRRRRRPRHGRHLQRPQLDHRRQHRREPDGDAPTARGRSTPGLQPDREPGGCLGHHRPTSSPDPVLDALDFNGGSTEMLALKAPALRSTRATPAHPASRPACEATDQRGQARGGAAGTCDIGAFEARDLNRNRARLTSLPPAPPLSPPSRAPGGSSTPPRSPSSGGLPGRGLPNPPNAPLSNEAPPLPAGGGGPRLRRPRRRRRSARRAGS